MIKDTRMLLRGKMWRGIILREGGYGGHINLITKEKIQHGSQSLPQTQFFLSLYLCNPML